jgi:ATP-dependent Clp protease adapter protein ClpS|tara:strand:- start:1376 stop:1543 length:168 start_codon:yes stop_codon:yes gene_type:complete
MKNAKLTSVNVNKNNHKKFKMLSIEDDITFQSLVNIVLEKYIRDIKFRKMINENK